MKFTLKEKKQETSDVTSFIFDTDENITWHAGQFIHYILPHDNADDRGTERWFTVSSAPFEDHPMITTRFAGDTSSSFKKALFNMHIGDEIEGAEVEGDFTVDDPMQSYVFIAGGIGITPYHAILKQLDHDQQPINVTLLYANHDENVVFKNELEEIASRNPGLKIHYIFSPAHIDEAIINEFVPELMTQLFYVSGPEPMVESMIAMLKNMGIPESNIKGDWFPGYKAE